MMNAEEKAKWLEAMKSGQYKHVRKMFVTDDAKCHCATGVFIDLFLPNAFAWTSIDDLGQAKIFYGLFGPDFVWNEFWLEHGLDTDDFWKVVAANDSDDSYAAAIAYIEEHL